MIPISARLWRLGGWSLAGLWILQLGWLAWHFAPEAQEIVAKLGAGGMSQDRQARDPFDLWLADLARVIPPGATYVLVDCYETGNYARMRYALYPRRQIRVDPKTTPISLYEEIRENGAAYIIVGGCQLTPVWEFLFQPELALFRPLLSGLGQVYQTDPTRLTGGFYD